MKRVRLSIIALLLSALFCCGAAAKTEFPEKLYLGNSLSEYANLETVPDIDGYSAYLYNIETGSVLYQKNQNNTVFPASTVKLMTAIVAYENIPDLNTVIKASKSAVLATKGSNMAIKTGEELTAEQLLYGLLVRGANDAANVLAEYVAGSIDEFCEMMNEKAKEIGAEKTNFVNPTGLHDEKMVTTARDVAIIARYFYHINTLFEMSDTTRYTIPETEYTEQRILLNRNYLISRVSSDKYFYSYAAGMSLGGTPEAGECIVSTASGESDLTYICVVMNSPSDKETNYACTDAKKLLQMALNDFKSHEVLTEKSVVCEVPVHLAVDTDYVTLRPDASVKALLPKNMNFSEDIYIEPRVSDDYISAPVYEGIKYGEAVVKYKEEIIIGTVELVASKNVDKSNVLYFLDRAETLFLGTWFKVFAVSAVLLLGLYFYASVKYEKRRRNRRYMRR